MRSATGGELQQTLHEIDDELTARIRGLRETQGRLRRLAAGQLTPLPAEVGAHLEDLARSQIPALIQGTVNASSPAWQRLDTLMRAELGIHSGR